MIGKKLSKLLEFLELKGSELQDAVPCISLNSGVENNFNSAKLFVFKQSEEYRILPEGFSTKKSSLIGLMKLALEDITPSNGHLFLLLAKINRENFVLENLNNENQ